MDAPPEGFRASKVGSEFVLVPLPELFADPEVFVMLDLPLLVSSPFSSSSSLLSPLAVELALALVREALSLSLVRLPAFSAELSLDELSLEEATLVVEESS